MDAQINSASLRKKITPKVKIISIGLLIITIVILSALVFVLPEDFLYFLRTGNKKLADNNSLNNTPPRLNIRTIDGLENCTARKENNPLVVLERTILDGLGRLYVLHGNIDNIKHENGVTSFDLLSAKADQKYSFKDLTDEQGLVHNNTLKKDVSINELKNGTTVTLSYQCFEKNPKNTKVTQIAFK